MKKINLFILMFISVFLLTSPVSAKKLAPGVFIHPLGYQNIIKEVKRTIKKVKRQSHTRYAVKEAPPVYTYKDPQSHLAYVVKQNGLSDYDYRVLNSIMYCESKYNPNATNPYSGASGLFQFLGSSWAAWGQGSVFDPAKNIEAAVRYYKVAGVSPWIQCIY